MSFESCKAPPPPKVAPTCDKDRALRQLVRRERVLAPCSGDMPTVLLCRERSLRGPLRGLSLQVWPAVRAGGAPGLAEHQSPPELLMEMQLPQRGLSLWLLPELTTLPSAGKLACPLHCLAPAPGRLVVPLLGPHDPFSLPNGASVVGLCVCVHA